jgi:hypothetical protein
MAGLIVRKPDGSILLDSSRITYGLLRSGYLTRAGTWPRKALRSIQLDPNNGQNWADNVAMVDDVWSFTVYGAVAPMLFLTGDGTLNGSTTSGDTVTYYFLNARSSTKVYAFDQMREMGSGPRLRTRNVFNGVVTFNSYMVPLNVIATVQAPTIPSSPPPPFNPTETWRATTYNGGYNVYVRYIATNTSPIMYSKVDIPLSGEEYAACITFTRGGTVEMQDPSGANHRYGISEGAGGYNGGVTFMFGPAGGTPLQNSGGSGTRFNGILTDRLPTALIVRTSNLPFPFN